jgi:hypothetical protein
MLNHLISSYPSLEAAIAAREPDAAAGLRITEALRHLTDGIRGIALPAPR